jgi:predicted amidophosphoribosyltransferase
MNQEKYIQLTLFCPDCYAPWQQIDDNTVCTVCQRHTVPQQFKLSIDVPITAYTAEEAISELTALVDALTHAEVLPKGSRVS